MALKMSHPNSVTTAPMATNESAVIADQNIFFWKGVGDIEGQIAEERLRIQEKAPRKAEIATRIFAVHPHPGLGNFRVLILFRAMTTIT
jgi:hypothetical protein